ncbi:hypothetical protein PR048_019913 [Dryococelus australis]|uniref:Uncharacterized protein n=1 Tax=Dryococelus australis TaxID=614101 RepID=A0ABQ9H4U1_9NEOP|nr:hypothetical protein PR048_019913 [Dryococelus australis]
MQGPKVCGVCIQHFHKCQTFHCPLNVLMGLAVDIVNACVVSLYLTRNRDGYNRGDSLRVGGLEENDAVAYSRGSKEANSVYEMLLPLPFSLK